MNPLFAVTVSTLSSEGSILSILGHTGIVVRVVLLILIALSLACWTIIIAKFLAFRRINNETMEFITKFHQQKSLGLFYRDSRIFSETPLVFIFRAGYTEFIRFLKSIEVEKVKRLGQLSLITNSMKETVSRAMQTASIIERGRMEKWTPLLASTGSSSPFIGLFGTVWGIMNSFRHIGLQGSANLAVVAPGIAEALIATAIGLATAIPAVIAYNYFMKKISDMENTMNHFMNDFLNLIEKEWMKKSFLESSHSPLSTAIQGE